MFIFQFIFKTRSGNVYNFKTKLASWVKYKMISTSVNTALGPGVGWFHENIQVYNLIG